MNSLISLKQRQAVSKTSVAKISNERNVLFRTFPETLWILILNKLAEYPEILFAIANSSLVLQDLLQNYNMLNFRLFALVWPILFNHVILQPDFLENKTFYRSVTVGYRGVCKTWCNVIDNFFSTHPGHYPNSTEHFQVKPNKAMSEWPAILRALNLQTDGVFMANKNFQRHFDSTHEQTERSPFVSGAVELQYTGVRHIDQVQDEVIEKYGRRIFHCSMKIPVTQGIYHKFTQLITQMPNIKSLHIDRVTTNYRRNVRQNLLPTLQNLKHLVIGSVYDHEFVTVLLENYSGTLTHLEFLRDDCLFGKLPEIVFTKLEHFKIAITEAGGVRLLDLARSAHTVEIDFRKLLCRSLSYVVQTLEEKLDKSCKTLILSLPTGWMQAESQCERLHLGSVQRLKLTLTGYMPVDFVLGIKNTLGFLHVVFPERLMDEKYPLWKSWNTFEVWKSNPLGASILKKEEIKFLSCLNYLNRSNIWDMLPKLEILRVDRWDGRRLEHWERNGVDILKRVWQN